MAASNNNNAHKPELTLPTSIAQTMRMVQRVAHSASWSERITRQHQPPSAADFGPRLFRRFDAANAPGQWADAFAQRFVADELPPSSSALTLAPHAPAQRQVSAARQGALSWSGGDRFSSPASSFGSGSIDRFADADASQSLIGDLMGNGWGVQSARSDTLRRFAEPASPEPTSRPAHAQINRSPAPTAAPVAPAQRQASEPIRRAPESPAAAPAQTPATINRQADAPAASSESSAADSAATESSAVPASDDSAAASSPVQRSADSAADVSSATTSPAAASEATPPIETAGTRPMTFFRGTPQSPLMRMGLSESTGGSDAPAAPTTINRQPASGELPVVRPARGSDEPSFAAPAPTSGAINRRAEQTPVASSPQVTSSNIVERTSSSDARSDSVASPEIQRSAIDQPAAPAAQVQAAASESAQPEVQRQAAPTSSAPTSDGTIDRSASAASAAPTTAADTTLVSTVAQAPVQRSEAATSGATAESTQATTTPASIDQISAASGSVDQPTSASGAGVVARSTSDVAAPVQHTASAAEADSSSAASAESGSSAAEAIAADASTTAESAAPTVSTPAQRAPVIQRQPVQPARASSIDTVLPLATRLLQRYSAGSSQGTSGSMPLLRTFAPTTAAVMRNATPIASNTASAQTLGNIASTGASATGSVNMPPLVHRSPIVPMLPTATLQREPATSGTAAAATPAPRAATPALEWSALPLLQRLSGTHALPAAPAAGTPSASVAAQVINRLAIDQPGAAPMPLLRMQTSNIARTADVPAASSSTSMRAPAESAADSSSGFSSDAPASRSATNDDAGSQDAGLGGQPAAASAGFDGPSTPAIHRSAILPSLTSASFQPLTLLRVHTPDAPSMAQAEAAPGRSPLQRSPDASGNIAPSASPIMMRAADQTSISAPVATSGEQAGNAMPSTGNVNMPPLVHRSPIVPMLPTATLQREPATSGTAAAATPAPRAATPALEWSALPLLQRLSGTHALPAAPAAGTPSASVAAQVINRLAIDQPGAAPMPLLRMHAPAESPLLSRAAEPSTAQTADSAGSATDSQAAQPSVMSSLVRRSAILPSAPSFAAQAEPAGATAAPTAEISGGALQRSPAADYALPMLQRTSVQRFFGSRPALKLPSLGGIQNSVNSLTGQAQGMVNQVTGLPNQMMGQAQGMIDQVTGLPNQMMGQAQGMIDQVTGTPNQLMGQAQGMIDQVTGLPNQLMGQAQGMIDQVTGLPNQLMGQAQGMIDQVTGLPNQLMGQAQGMIDQVTGMPNQLMGQAQGMIDQVTGMPNQLMGQAQGMIDQVTGMPNQLMGQAQGMIDQVTGMPGQLMGQAQGMLGQISGFPGQMQDAASNLVGARSAQLTLLRPVRSESQSAPVRDQGEAQGETSTGSTSAAAGGAGGAGAQGAGEAGKQGKPDIDMLAQQVYARLRHRLLIDRERLGR